MLDIVRDMLGQQQRQLDDWLAAQAAARGLSVEELAERYTLEAEPMETYQDGFFRVYHLVLRAEQNYRLRARTEGPRA